MSNPLRVLLIEDNPGDIDLILELLPQQGSAQFKVECVSRLSEAIDSIGTSQYDIILLDLGLPDSNGLATLSAIRRQVPHLPVVVLTGNTDERVALAAIQEDAQDYLVKGKIDELQLTRSIKYAFERNKAEQKLLASEIKFRKLSQEYHTLLNTLPDGVVHIAPDLKIIWTNRAMTEMIKVHEDQLQGKCCYQAFWNSTRQCDSCPVAQCFLTGKIEEGNTTIKNGRILELRAVPISNDSGKVESVIEIIRDVTEHRKLEAQFIQAQKMESVGRLAGGVAHDFNNMLSVIVGYSEMALAKLDPLDPIHEDLQEIYEAGVRSTDITRQLLAFARKQTIAPVALDLNEAVKGMLKMLHRLIGEDIDLAWLPKNSPLPVMMDPSQVDQLLANLCVNARDAIHGVGRVTIETEEVVFDEAYCADHHGFVPGEYVLLAVSDDGCGMGPDTLAKIFEPFFTTKAVGRGTGLGLATVYGIVKQNNGFINVYSEPGKGTTIKIYLARQTDAQVKVLSDSPANIPMGHGEIILVVEDETSILRFTKRMLEELGYTVLAAESPNQALELAEKRPNEIDLLITDVVMPEMNGKELSHRLHEAYPNLKTIFMSGYTANGIAHRGVLEKDANFIQKPFSAESMAQKVRATLDI
jgi:two-component system, cell cycle sensor histidine kinase and response regulator CckA